VKNRRAASGFAAWGEAEGFAVVEQAGARTSAGALDGRQPASLSLTAARRRVDLAGEAPGRAMHTRNRRSFCVALAGLPLASCAGDGALAGLPGGREGLVTGVQSGDLLQLDGKETVRLAGLEAPRGDRPYAEASRAMLQKLAQGRRVSLFFSGAETDKAGRTMAQVTDADSRRWLQAALLDQGAARVRTWPDNHAAAAPLFQHEARARRARRGLWAIPFYDVRLPDEVGVEDEGFMLVEGRVKRVGETGERLYLDFSENWRASLSADIPRQALRTFRTAGQDPFDLEGRLIRLRGPVSARRLLLDHPEQIERLSG
jgi:endonuclease YncB( thermonuclease family)